MSAVSAAQLRRMLARRFSAPAWAILFEVKSSTGHTRGEPRAADALAISLWPSRGLAIHGVEIKTNRADWLRELKNPQKSAPVQEHCNFWWIAAPKGVVELDELPPTWGLLEPTAGGKLVAKYKAPELRKDQAVSLEFVAAMGRRMNECVEKAKALVREELRAERDEDQLRKDEYQRGLLDGAPALREARDDLQHLQRQLKQFEDKSGVDIDHWNIGDIGVAAGLIAKQRVTRADVAGPVIDQLERVLKQMKSVQAALSEFRPAGKEPGQ